jgi:FlaA1/EpsC-like NDP-sugar epimerase
LIDRSFFSSGGINMAIHNQEIFKQRIPWVDLDDYRISLFNQYVRRILLDWLIIPLAFYMGWFIRFDGQVPVEEWYALTRYVVPITLVYLVVNAGFGLYRRLWAYASFRDVLLLTKSTGVSTMILLAVNYSSTFLYGYRLPMGGLIIGSLLNLTLSAAAKYRRQLMNIFFASWARSKSEAERVLIVGVSEAAQQLATQMYLGHGGVNYELVGFVIDDPKWQGMNINGVEVLGASDQILALVRDRHIDVIVIAHQPFDREKIWSLVSICRETSAQVKVLPDLVEVVERGYEDPLALRDINLEDVLGRAPVSVDDKACERILADKVVVVTGAAGSIGSELCRQILRFNPRLVLALDNNETGLYELDLELNRNGQSPLHLMIADVSDWRKINWVFERYKPQVVFHAAAYKHVPLVEAHPEEAVRVNMLGTIIVSEAAHEHCAERFVFISTDKAVKPGNVMGASKRIGELWMESMSERSDTIFTAVRFGNVIGSRGSVLPTFKWQIESGGPVTVTHPEMYRYFLSIPEAVNLVLQAASFSQGGDIFMLEMGEEVSILSLAQRMIRLKGLRVQKDIGIEFIGVRPGEKLHEELAYTGERKEETSHPRIYSLRSSYRPIDHDTLLGAALILSDSLRLPGKRNCVHEALFEVASRDIEGFLNRLTGIDMTKWYQMVDVGDKDVPDEGGAFNHKDSFYVDGISKLSDQAMPLMSARGA